MYPPPPPWIVVPAAGTKLRTSTASLWGYGSPGDQLHLYDNGTLKASTTLNESRQWFLDVTGLADGTHRFTVRASNSAGLSAPSAERVVEVFTQGPKPPVITSPAHNTRAASRTITFTGTAAPNTTIELFENDRSVAKFPSGNGQWTYTLKAQYGLNRYQATATDAQGNTSELSPEHRIRV
jgi:hypothetical protein